MGARPLPPLIIETFNGIGSAGRLRRLQVGGSLLISGDNFGVDELKAHELVVVGLATALLLTVGVEAEAVQSGHVWFSRSSSTDVGGAWWHWVFAF